jgi:8-hydroxy-5-deazaflavin:NADPH oxidoreductase
MVDPSRVSGEHNVFICGDDQDAKRQVSELLRSFDWPAEAIVDLGGISAARATEMYLPLWLHLYERLQTGDFNICVMR